MITLKGKQIATAASSGSAKQIGTNSKKVARAEQFKSDQFTSESTSGQKTNLSNLPITLDLDPLLFGIAEDTNYSRTTFTRLYKDMYYYDAVCGSAVDLYSTLPFSEFTLGGINDVSVMETFMENIERLNIRTLLNELSIDYLVTGAFLGSLLYNKEKKLFFDIMPHDIGNAEITPLPFYSQDPLIKVQFPDTVRKALAMPSKRIDQIKEKLGPQVIEKLMSGSLELDPLGTLYLPRKTFACSEGTSFYKRILPIYLIEKNLFRGTLVESAKRQRGILHITVGDGDQWEPTLAEMESITDLFMSADADPLGAVIATRLGISTEEIRSGGDFWKVTDIFDQTMGYKLKAMGIPETFITGDATLNCVVGNSLVPTSNGLLKIGKICKQANGNVQNVYFNVCSRNGIEKASRWVYSGEQQTISVTSESGNTVTGTYKHRLLILRKGKLEWEYLVNIRITDYLCLCVEPIVRHNHFITANRTIDEELAYLLGCLLKRGYRVGKNTKVLLPKKTGLKFQELFSKLFYPIEFVEQKEKYSFEISDSETVSLLEKLVGGKNALPWSICKTSSSAQLAFVAALVDNASCSRICFDSPTLGKELLILLNSLGIMCDLKFNSIVFPEGESFYLYQKIASFCAEEHSVIEQQRTWYGVPHDGEIISHEEYGDCEIAKNKYRFTKVTSIKDAGVQPVFDLSVNKYNPSYVVNGVVSHNTSETSLSVMIESMRAYRDTITRRLLYNKIFPLISVVNGFAIKNGKIIKSGRPHEIEDALDRLQDGSRLLIPVVHWNKQLKPEGDTAYLDLLDRMTAAGVPVPLRAMAAAGGFNLDELLVQQDDDLLMRERIKEYTDKLSKFKAQQEGEEGGGGYGSESSASVSELDLIDQSPDKKYFSSVLANGGRRNLLNRKFDGEITGQTKTGKKKFIADQTAANKKANQAIVKAVKSYAKRNDSPLSRTTTTKEK